MSMKKLETALICQLKNNRATVIKSSVKSQILSILLRAVAITPGRPLRLTSTCPQVSLPNAPRLINMGPYGMDRETITANGRLLCHRERHWSHGQYCAKEGASDVKQDLVRSPLIGNNVYRHCAHDR